MYIKKVWMGRTYLNICLAQGNPILIIKIQFFTHHFNMFKNNFFANIFKI